MATKRDKRVSEINGLRNILPDTNYEIEMIAKSGSFGVRFDSYKKACEFLLSWYPESYNIISLEQVDSKYAFASFATMKSVQKEVMIQVSQVIFKNYKTKSK